MRRVVWPILFFCTTTLLAQASYFGPKVPLANTRYGPLRGTPVLAANGSETFLFTATGHNVRMVALADAHRIARPVLDATDVDVAWDGARFLVAGTSGGSIVGRFVDAGQPFTMLGNASKPRLALPLMLFAREGGVHAVTLSSGVANGTATQVAANAIDFDAATNGSESFAVVATNDAVKLLALSRDGAVMSETRLADAAREVSLASDGQDFLALWTSDEGAEAAVVRRNGAVEEPFAIAEGARAPSLAWTNGSWRAAMVIDDELRLLAVSPASRGAAPASLTVYGAAEQSLADTASTPNAALMVWNEGDDAYLGLRGPNGTWRERLLASNDRAIAAAAHPSHFAVLTENGDGWSVTLLDESGNAIARSARNRSFRARDVALSSSVAAVIGVDGNRNVLAAAVHRDGAISEVFPLRTDGEDPAIASDGTSFFAVWQTSAMTIEGIRPGVDANPVMVFDVEAEDPAVAFNGREYVVAWRGGPYVRGRRVRVDGTPIREFVQTGRVGGAPPLGIHVTGLGDGKAGLSWTDGRAQLLLFDGWDVQTAKGFDSRTGASPRVVLLPAAGPAVAMSDLLDDAPHHGSARLMLATAHAALPPAPAAPSASVTQNAGKIHVSWTPASPANGYRVEYRVDGGPWLEAEGWSEGTSLTVDPSRAGLYAIRVRAFGDGGMSAYSEPVEITVSGRRRAVR